jgi:hypothetical protein
VTDVREKAIILFSLRKCHSSGFSCGQRALADYFGRHRVRFANARRRLIELEYFKPVRQADRSDVQMVPKKAR